MGARAGERVLACAHVEADARGARLIAMQPGTTLIMPEASPPSIEVKWALLCAECAVVGDPIKAASHDFALGCDLVLPCGP